MLSRCSKHMPHVIACSASLAGMRPALPCPAIATRTVKHSIPKAAHRKV